MKYFVFLLSVLVLLSCSESSESYNKRAFAVVDSLIDYSETTFSVASMRQSAWRTAIFDNEYKNPLTGEYKINDRGYKSYVDFNEALQYFDEDMKLLFMVVESEKKKADSLYATIKEHPDDSEDVYDNIKELFHIYSLSVDMALDAEGSLKSYSNNLNNLYSDFKEMKTKIEIDKK